MPGVAVAMASIRGAACGAQGAATVTRRRAVYLLADAERVRRQAAGADGARAVLPHRVRIVTGAVAAIERAVEPAAHAAGTAEEAVADAPARSRQQRMGDDVGHDAAKAGRRRQRRVREGEGLEQRSHPARRREPAETGIDGCRLVRIRSPLQAYRPRFDPQRLQEAPLRHRAEHTRPAPSRRPRQRREVDMGGQIGLSGIAQHGMRAVSPDGLERVAETRRGVPVIHDQRGAAVRRHAPGDGSRERLARRRPLDDGAGGRARETHNPRMDGAGGAEAEARRRPGPGPRLAPASRRRRARTGGSAARRRTRWRRPAGGRAAPPRIRRAMRAGRAPSGRAAPRARCGSLRPDAGGWRRRTPERRARRGARRRGACRGPAPIRRGRRAGAGPCSATGPHTRGRSAHRTSGSLPAR